MITTFRDDICCCVWEAQEAGVHRCRLTALRVVLGDAMVSSIVERNTADG